MARTTIADVVARQDAQDLRFDALTAQIADLAAAIRGGSAAAPVVAVEVKAPAKDKDFFQDVIVRRAQKREAAGKPTQRVRKVTNQVNAGMSIEDAVALVDARAKLSRDAHRAARKAA